MTFSTAFMISSRVDMLFLLDGSWVMSQYLILKAIDSIAKPDGSLAGFHWLCTLIYLSKWIKLQIGRKPKGIATLPFSAGLTSSVELKS